MAFNRFLSYGHPLGSMARNEQWRAGIDIPAMYGRCVVFEHNCLLNVTHRGVLMGFLFLYGLPVGHARCSVCRL